MSDEASLLIQHLKTDRKTLSTVESCTGGMLFSDLTAVPGASAVLDRGFVTYSNQAKQDMVGVHTKTLAVHGAVSQQTAEEMALGGLKAAGTTLSVSLTGIAGADGGTKTKPVGLVWISVCDDKGRQITKDNYFTGDRQQIRKSACDAAISLVLSLLKKQE